MKSMHLKDPSKLRISIITLTLNAEKTLEKTIRSVIDQHYPNTELMIFDGGSTDGTVDIIKRYEMHLAYWQSEIDHAPDYNIALPKATGDIICFLNADDWYEGDILHRVAEMFKQRPKLDIVSCAAQLVEQKNKKYKRLLWLSEKELAVTVNNSLRYPAINARFFHRRIIEKFTPFNTFNDEGKYQYTHDKQFMLALAFNQLNTVFINQLGHTFLKHDQSRTFSGKSKVILKSCEEHMQLAEQYWENKILRQWYRENMCRYLIHAILCGKLSAAFKKIKNVSKKDLSWCFGFFHTLWLIAVSRLKRFSSHT